MISYKGLETGQAACIRVRAQLLKSDPLAGQKDVCSEQED
jgi:hypothetical protein